MTCTSPELRPPSGDMSHPHRRRQSSRAYRALLGCYPRVFRNEYGDEMERIFLTRRDAVSGFAVITLWIEETVDVLGSAVGVHWDLLVQDVRYTWRTLGRSPAFAVTAVVIAAMGIAATTAAFSIADHVLVRPLPFPDSDRLVKLWQDQSQRGYGRIEVSPLNYVDWKRLATSYEGMSAYTVRSVNLVGQGEPERLDAALATTDLFSVLQVQAALGRSFIAADGLAASPRVVIVSDGVWRAKFAADPGVLGRSVVLDDEPHLVVGVMPAGFEFPSRTVDVWSPLRFSESELEDRADLFLHLVARLRTDITVDHARSELRVITAQLERDYPEANAQTSGTLHLLRDQVSVQARTLLMALVAASACMLLIACANLANLLLARALARQRELAVRAAIGASRDRLVRQMLTESLLLSGAGGVFGVLLGIAATPLVARLVPTTMPIAEVPNVDLRMLSLAALVTMITGIGFGLVPAWRTLRGVDSGSLRQGSRTGSSRSTERWRSALVVAEIGASVVLLVASGLLIRALWRVSEIEPGFRTENVLTLRTALPWPKYSVTERRQQFYDRVIEEVRALPGVSNAAYTSFLPMVMGGGIWPVDVPGTVVTGTPSASLRFVTTGYFDTMGIPLLRGRGISDADTRNSPLVAVVSDSFAKEHWPGADPIGRRFTMAFFERTVVGIVGNVRVRGLERESEPQVYLPPTQVPDGGLIFYPPKDLVIAARVPVTTLVPAVRHIINAVDPQQPISDVQRLSDIVTNQTAARRTQVRVLTGFSIISFVLAAVGIHGLLTFAVSSRTKEIGVRVALGARPGGILRMILGRGLMLATVGVIIGVGVAVAVGRWLQAILAGVSPNDAPVFGSAIGLVLVMTLAGSLLPALGALRIDPIQAIRTD